MNKNKHRSNITGRMIVVTVVGVMLLTLIFAVVFILCKKNMGEEHTKELYGQVIVSLNAIDKQVETDYPSVHEEIAGLMKQYRDIPSSDTYFNNGYILAFYICSLIFMFVVFGIVYVMVLRPFHELEDYAEDIAAGNLDAKLDYKRVNMFGQFTWAFDHMCKEIVRARTCEKEAVENNKTVIATLSHDIKTPIASIRAYSEALLENMDQTPERRKRYIDVIMRKCDEVTKITNDMFLHALHDLDKLVIKKETVDLQAVIKDTVASMEGAKEDIVMRDILPYTLEEGDSSRIAQVIENIINNARKYSDGKIYIDTEQNNDGYRLSMKDEGPGIDPEDMPFIFQKFYRGKNQADKPGAGLGLFIVKYVMEQMNGAVTLVNEKDGLLVCLDFFQKNDKS